MKTERLLILLTVVNAGLFAYQMVRPPSTAATTDVQTVIRGRALEIVDDRGRVRASLSVLPEDPKHIPKIPSTCGRASPTRKPCCCG